jgi:hypothetical protein
MTEQSFDHERLDVYCLSIDYVARSFEAAQPLEGLHRHARDQWLRAAQSIPLNIAESNGKRSLKDCARFLDIARGSALGQPAYAKSRSSNINSASIMIITQKKNR